MKRALIVVAAALSLTACETATPYQPLSAQRIETQGGYSDQQIEANRWKVMFSGNSLTSRDTVERYLLFRASQLTLRQGFDWFYAVDRHTNRQTSYYGDPYFGGWDGGLDYALYRPGFGWGYGYGGFGPYGGFGYGGLGGGGFDIDQISQYQASVEVVMGHGPKPADNPHAYDAHQVVEHLQGTIAYPKR